jgi:hypothetical protein
MMEIIDEEAAAALEDEVGVPAISEAASIVVTTLPFFRLRAASAVR